MTSFSKICQTTLQGYTKFGSIGCGVSKAEGNGVLKEDGKESVWNVKLDIEVSRGLNLFYISNCI